MPWSSRCQLVGRVDLLDAHAGQTGTGTDDDVWANSMGDGEAEELGPDRGESLGVDGVDRDALHHRVLGAIHRFSFAPHTRQYCGAWVLGSGPSCQHQSVRPPQLSIPFALELLAGRIEVTIAPSTAPESIGCPPWELGFPVCEAAVTTTARGYAALMGWVQLVAMRSPPATRFEWTADPLEIYGGLNTPFGFYGIAPTLFDAPSRRDRTRSLEWRAESYLCVAPSSPMTREALPVAAFSWGFTMANGEISIAEPHPIPLSTWTGHVQLLESEYPGWVFEIPTDA